MSIIDYIPKRKGPAAGIVDLHDQVPSFLLRQDRAGQGNYTAQQQATPQQVDRLAELDAELGRYIDSRNKEDAVQQREQEKTVEPSTKIAELIPFMSHREFKEWVGTAVLGVDMNNLSEEDRRRIWETCDRVEAWAARKLTPPETETAA